VLFLLAASACGGSGTRSAAELRSCVSDRLPAGAVDRVVTSTEEGVTSLIYYHAAGQTVVSVFKTAGDAQHALEAEARIGDAHDRRVGSVLYSGGGAIEAAVVACAK
jgi:hypothetical protein